jgi:23S rRNA pseudouridine1911/1915/1917 synthase
LHTGRHHQIRAQLAAIGSPIKGDAKYGFRRSNQDRSIHLHAWKIAFTHPISGAKEEIVAPLPVESLWDFFGEAVGQSK